MGLSLEYIISFEIGIFFAIVSCCRLIYAYFKFGSSVIRGPKYRSRPMVLSDPKYGKSGYLHLQNITMHYVEIGDRSKPLLLLVHGFPEFWFSWRKQLNSELADHFHIVAVDQRGYADSDKPQSISDYKIEMMVEDLREAILALGHSSCNLAGHDWGGAIVWAFAAKHPDMVDKLAVMNCPHPAAFQAKLRSSRSQFSKSWYMFMFQIPRFAEWFIGRGDFQMMKLMMSEKPSIMTEEELEAFKYTFGQADGLRGPVNYYRSAMLHRSMGDVGRVKVPTMLIYGAGDKYIGIEAIEDSSNYCDKMKLEILPNVSHWVQQEAPGQVNRLLLQHFSKVAQVQQQQQQILDDVNSLGEAIESDAAAAVDAVANGVKGFMD